MGEAYICEAVKMLQDGQPEMLTRYVTKGQPVPAAAPECTM